MWGPTFTGAKYDQRLCKIFNTRDLTNFEAQAPFKSNSFLGSLARDLLRHFHTFLHSPALHLYK